MYLSKKNVFVCVYSKGINFLLKMESELYSQVLTKIQMNLGDGDQGAVEYLFLFCFI